MSKGSVVRTKNWKKYRQSKLWENIEKRKREVQTNKNEKDIPS